MPRPAFIACVCLLLLGCSRKPDAESIQGTWRVTAEQREGKAVEPPSAASVNFLDEQITFRKANDEPGLYGTILLTPDRSPAEIDIAVGGGRVLRGIYKISGGTLMLCYADDSRPRPKGFSAEGQSVTLLTLKRE